MLFTVILAFKPPFVGRGPVKPISRVFSLHGEWPTLSLNLVNDRTYRYELSAI